MRRLRHWLKQLPKPSVSQMADQHSDPYRVLVATLLSLRTKDEVTATAAARLFEVAATPKQIVSLPLEVIQKLIYPVGFYKTKALTLQQISRDLLERFNGKVPDDLDSLLTLKGVGRKTANLVLILGFRKPGICVDTHVHRISNRWGYIRTRQADESEMALRKKLPHKYWMEYNDLLVTFGQHICQPVSPLCSQCPLLSMCPQIGVLRKR